MSTITKFEDLDIWQKAKKLAFDIGGFINYLNKSDFKGTKFKERL